MCWSNHRDHRDLRDAWVAERQLRHDARNDVRASDADRRAVIDQLSRHTGEGRLTLEEFEARVGEALEARTTSDLRLVLRELPVERRDRRAMRPRPAPGAIRAVALWTLIVVAAIAFIGAGALWWLVPLAFFRFGGFGGHHHRPHWQHRQHDDGAELRRGDDLTLV
jgi:hypothetical protein